MTFTYRQLPGDGNGAKKFDPISMIIPKLIYIDQSA